MITLHMLVDESYIDEFVRSLPSDKVRIIEENFKENKNLLEVEYNNYLENSESFFPYSQSIKNTSKWLDAEGEK